MKRLIAIILSGLLILSMAACGSSGGSSAAEAGSSGGAGTFADAGVYDIVSVQDGDRVTDRAALEAEGLFVTLQLREDGSGSLDFGDGDALEATWQDGSVTMGGETVSYALSGGTLTIDLSDSDGKYILTFRAPAESAPETVSEGKGAKGAEAPAAPASETTAAPEPASAQEPASAPEPAPTSEPAPEPSEAPQSIGPFTPVSADLEDCHVVILGAEAISSSDGDAVRFYYEFTNNSDAPTSAFFHLYFKAEEDGRELDATYDQEESALYGNELLRVQPGVTIRCTEDYEFDPAGKELTFNISLLFDDGFTAVFDPANLPGPPKDTWSIDPIPDPQFYLNADSQGKTDDLEVTVTGAEMTEADAEKAVRFYFECTNLTDEASGILSLATVTAYQDGVELSYAFPEDYGDTDRAYNDDIPAGETVTISRCWQLRSDSPVEVAVTDWLEDNVICAGTLYLDS